MKNHSVEIKCYLVNCFCPNSYDVSIFDSDNHLICQGNSDSFGCFHFLTNRCGMHYITICFHRCSYLPPVIHKCFYVHRDTTIIPFVFELSLPQYRHPITLTLTDQHYKNLPIQKGEIQLWNI